MDEQRFFVDERGGCVAVRDRYDTDPQCQGLDPDARGVVWFKMFPVKLIRCDKCGHGALHAEGDVVVAEAKELCRQLNEVDARSSCQL